MSEGTALQYAISALGACLGCIGWWIGSELKRLNDKTEQVLLLIENHNGRIVNLERHIKEL